MRVMIDLNVFLDVFQNREAHRDSSARILAGAVRNNWIGLIPNHGITTFYYVLRKFAGRAKADQAVEWVLKRFEVGVCTKKTFIAAQALSFGDFEDAVVASAAQEEGCEYIITRNVENFGKSPVPAITPDEFLAREPR